MSAETRNRNCEGKMLPRSFEQMHQWAQKIWQLKLRCEQRGARLALVGLYGFEKLVVGPSEPNTKVGV